MQKNFFSYEGFHLASSSYNMGEIPASEGSGTRIILWGNALSSSPLFYTHIFIFLYTFIYKKRHCPENDSENISYFDAIALYTTVNLWWEGLVNLNLSDSMSMWQMSVLQHWWQTTLMLTMVSKTKVNTLQKWLQWIKLDLWEDFETSGIKFNESGKWKMEFPQTTRAISISANNYGTHSKQARRSWGARGYSPHFICPLI